MRIKYIKKRLQKQSKVSCIDPDRPSHKDFDHSDFFPQFRADSRGKPILILLVASSIMNIMTDQSCHFTEHHKKAYPNKRNKKYVNKDGLDFRSTPTHSANTYTDSVKTKKKRKIRRKRMQRTKPHIPLRGEEIYVKRFP